jgi:ABC-2 type transport system ATP-binding protein
LLDVESLDIKIISVDNIPPMTSVQTPPASQPTISAQPQPRPSARQNGEAIGPAIEAVDLVRTYRTHTGIIRRKQLDVEAVKGVSFHVEPGELFGLLGPNGAGKTTTIKMLITLLLPTSGTARVMGHDVVKETNEVRKRIGYVFGGDRGLYDRVSGLDNLRYFAELYGVDPGEQKQRIAALLELVGLSGREREKVEGYSRGMRQRLHIARGLLHDPEVVFMDEPSIGLDPIGARELRQTVQSLVDAGKTVLLTTHYMFEADALCDRIAVINDGRIVALGTGEDLKREVANRTIVEIETFGVTPEAVDRLRADEDVIAVNTEERDQSQILMVQSEHGLAITQRLLGLLGDTRVGKVIAREPTLEDAYIHLIASTSDPERAARATAALA